MRRGVQGAEAQLWLGQPSAAARPCQPIAAAGKSRGHMLPAPGLCAACPGGTCCQPQGYVLPASGASPDF